MATSKPTPIYTTLTDVTRHERSAERLNWRNGYRERTLDTRLGQLQLRIPKLRQGSYFPPFLEPRKTSEKALVSVIQEAWIGGVSTRRVDDLVQAMGLAGISKSQVSKVCKEIDERVNGFLDRPLEGEWPYLWLDATYLKVREGGRVVSVAAIIAVAVTADGKREIVGLTIGPSEAEPFWAGFLKSLVRRGLKGVKLVISDAHEGLKHAITRVFGATWQRCRVHTIRIQSPARFDWGDAARRRIVERNDMTDLQAVGVDDDPVNDELQDGLLVSKGGGREPAPDAVAEGRQVDRQLLGLGALRAETLPLGQLALEGPALLGQLAAPLGQLGQSDGLGLIGIDQSPIRTVEAIEMGPQRLIGSLLPAGGAVGGAS